MQSIETHSEIRLFCDLDHTLIYSHRVPIGLNKIAVEYLNGKEQSFMTQGTYPRKSQSFIGYDESPWRHACK